MLAQRSLAFYRTTGPQVDSSRAFFVENAAISVALYLFYHASVTEA